ncbi:hypothetical protein LJC04_01680 [Ruminococcaceae bacterium OttesenSCG-928-O06]|nr:hypothetical protein [Ruminococcaceae bacterium OttesenSCG-928-O06]
MNPTPQQQPLVSRQKPLVGRRSGVGTGTTSLLMIFTVLCFATLAMLSLSTAAASMRTQGRGIATAQSAAAARGIAAAQVAALDAELAELREDADDAEAYAANAGLLAAAHGWQPAEDDALTFSLITPVSETTELLTVLRLQPLHEDGRYTVVQQITRLVDGWTPDGGQLWEGHGDD